MTQKNEVNLRIERSLRQPIAYVWTAVGLFLIALFVALLDLGAKFNQPIIFRLVVSLATPIAVIGHGAATWSEHTRSRLAHGIAFAAWMLISVSMSAYYVLSLDAQLRVLVERFAADLFSLGQTLYAALFGIGLTISLTAVVVDEAGKRRANEDGQVVIASLMPNVAITLAIVTSAVHLYDFGQRVAEVGVFGCLAATVMADVTFLAIKANIQTQLDARRKMGVYDAFDLIAWSAFGLLVAAYLIAINGAAVAANTAPSIAEFRREPVINALVWLYGMSPTVLLAGIAAMTVLTKVVDYRSDRFRTSKPQLQQGAKAPKQNGMVSLEELMR
ncbi:MAG: hypothetical protein ACK4JD_12590 [Thermoflexales bacterium]